MSYHYRRMLKLLRAELQTKGVAEGALRNNLHERYVKLLGKTKISPMAEAKTPKNTFFAWVLIKQMNELA